MRSKILALIVLEILSTREPSFSFNNYQTSSEIHEKISLILA